jgi:hypothetical protein
MGGAPMPLRIIARWATPDRGSGGGETAWWGGGVDGGGGGDMEAEGREVGKGGGEGGGGGLGRMVRVLNTYGVTGLVPRCLCCESKP